MGRARASGDVPAGMVFMPIHFNGQFAHAARVGAAVNAVVDPVSGEPEFKHTPARIEALVSDWRGFLLSRSVVSTGPGIWWAASQGSAAHRLEFVGRGMARPDQQWLRDTLQVPANAEWIEYEDPAGGNYRAAVLVEGRLEACMMIAGGDTLPARSWLQSLFDAARIDTDDRRCLLLGARADRVDPGPMVCACFAVGANVLRDAVMAGNISVAALGKHTRAGTNCGSCRPELSKIVATYCSKP
jgi:assimilatory nitrate reductase catalytic subunit